MKVAVVDGDPFPPPEHMYHATCVFDIIWDEEESKHPDASLFFTPTPPGTECYGGNTVAQSNGCRNSDHEPLPLHQPRPHLRAETAHDHSDASPLSSTPTITINNIKNTKTNHAATYNDHTSTNCEEMPTRQTPVLQTLEPTHATPPPHLPITPPPQCIDFDALKASILAGLICDTTTFQMTMPTTPPMLMTLPMPMTPPMPTTQPTTMMTKITTTT